MTDNLINPFAFSINKCAKCGKKDVLKYEDLHGDLHTQMIYPVKIAKCSECKEEYFIKWENVNGTMTPFYYKDDIINKFATTIIDYSISHRRKLL